MCDALKDLAAVGKIDDKALLVSSLMWPAPGERRRKMLQSGGTLCGRYFPCSMANSFPRMLLSLCIFVISNVSARQK